MADIDDKTCRICFKIKDVVAPLFEKLEGNEGSHYETLVKKTKLQIDADDAGPTYICSDCLIELDTTVTFLEKCERSNRVLAATYVRGFNEYSNFRFETTGVEYIEYNEVEIPQQPSSSRAGRSEESVHRSEESARDRSAESARDRQPRRRGSGCSRCESNRRCHHTEYTHTCQYCSKVFVRKFNYQLHVKRHLGQREWTCPGCGAMQLTRWHAERHCQPKMRHPCTVPRCGKVFTSKNNLDIHARIHTGERPFQCTHCKKSFTSKSTLKDHIRTHTGEKPYMCPVCGKRFATNKLSSHMQRHHKDSRSGSGSGSRPAPRSGSRSGSRPGPRSSTRPSVRPVEPHGCMYCGIRYRYLHSLNKHIAKVHYKKPATQTSSSTSQGNQSSSSSSQ